ncbi:archaeosine tRNA-ribosyltransferase [Methanococcus vannielii SB]|uniref:tRNA-guanine(15) transglycosylase n=1 Tax=Methanococcus vannielii (strain ATCC 35089 / DSM 1224 / JCM 13029 / OCM 148 / SB) TaxID=406327 RepID=ATGT_METVS|nr:tRNA guanosine(15) transglycosylase TgtA [Methanococcus vannielii]A6USA4.1 RecName: Full=tRNA-guanine(15) transglycosylase; AltName: Full=7-cyano-7-deazaguanine tRNA-ribosyltransferase; AltName: Full=Archaeal tRNA-guanine transglycosylase [Methanococcus vannielii SB]ABR55376.1 archaeosine tRNA-ribosyltransferase [Methanococcus vannielii SB]
MFEIKARDAMGRLGLIKINGKKIETPTIMPVVHPNPKKQTVSIDLINKLSDVIITNSYITYTTPELREIAENKGIHHLTGFKNVVVTDSGSFQLSVYGNVNVEPMEIIDFQEKIGVDVGTILDIPTAPDVSREKAEKELLETFKRAEDSIQRRNDRNYKLALNGTVQGSTHLDLRRKSAEVMGKMDFEIYPIGAVVPLMEDYRYREVSEIIINSKMHLPTNKPVHLFGCGHPMLFALSVALGCDLFDSAAYALYAKNGRYLTENGTLHLDELKDLKNFPCSCKVCSEYTPKQLQNMKEKERERLLAEHNLYVTFEEIDRIKNAIKDGNLWELVEERCRSHPKLLNGLRVISKYMDFIEKYDPVSKKSGFFYTGYESMARPEIYRHKQRLNRLKFDKIYVTSISEKINTPYSENLNNIPCDVDVLIKDSVFGLVPLNIDTMYPLSQNEIPDLYDFEKNYNNDFISEFLENNAEKVLDISTYNYYISHYNSKKECEKINPDLLRISRMLEYQYGAKIIDNDFEKLSVRRSKTSGRIRNVLLDKEVVFTVRASDNFLIPAKLGAEMLHKKLEFPKYRVIVDKSVEEFARAGKSVYSKFVINCDKELRPFEEVLVVNENDDLLAYGTNLLNSQELMEFDYGVAVNIRGGLKLE